MRSGNRDNWTGVYPTGNTAVTKRLHLADIARCLLDFVYPPHCVLCGGTPGDSAGVCSQCWDLLTVDYHKRCPRCSSPQDDDPIGPPPVRDPIANCPNCRKWDRTIEKALVLGHFEGTLQEAVHAIKFGGRRRLAQEMGRHLASVPQFRGDLERIDWLVPVPLHPTRSANADTIRVKLWHAVWHSN